MNNTANTSNRAKQIALAYDSTSWLPEVGTMFRGAALTQEELDAVRQIRTEWNKEYCKSHGIWQ